MEKYPKRCPICYDSHDDITYVRSVFTNDEWVCKACYTQGDDKYFRICFGEEPNKEELAELAVFRIRSLKNNLKKVREEYDLLKAQHDLFTISDAQLYYMLEEVQRQIKYRVMNSDKKPEYKVCEHKTCLLQSGEGVNVCFEHIDIRKKENESMEWFRKYLNQREEVRKLQEEIRILAQSNKKDFFPV